MMDWMVANSWFERMYKLFDRQLAELLFVFEALPQSFDSALRPK